MSTYSRTSVTGLSAGTRLWRWVSDLQPKIPVLTRAARKGDLAEVKRLLDLGADSNQQGLRGRTALHDAATREHPEVAAFLLACGANPSLEDRRGRSPLGSENVSRESLHRIRQFYHRRRDAHPPLIVRASSEAARLVGELAQNGIVRVSGLVGPEALARLKEEFERFIQSLEQKLERGEGRYTHYDEEEHYWENDLAFVCNNAFKYSAELAKLCCSQTLVDAAALYLGRKPHVQRGVAMRYLPFDGRATDMFDWHHDLEEKRFKVMVLLSDVGVGGQHMSYVLGSHKLLHPYAMYLTNSCSLEYCKAHLPQVEVFDAIGSAGDLFIFDSNGAHRGNRRATGNLRDVFLVEYTADTSHIWGGDIDTRFFAEMNLAGDHVFKRMMQAEKAWLKTATRKNPTWIENLPHVTRWL